MDSGDTLYCSEMGTHRFVSFKEGPFGEKMQFEVGEEGRECVGIMPHRYPPCIVSYAEPVGAGSQWPWYGRFE
jgi:hypothetical protein